MADAAEDLYAITPDEQTVILRFRGRAFSYGATSDHRLFLTGCLMNYTHQEVPLYWGHGRTRQIGTGVLFLDQEGADIQGWINDCHFGQVAKQYIVAGQHTGLSGDVYVPLEAEHQIPGFQWYATKARLLGVSIVPKPGFRHCRITETFDPLATDDKETCHDDIHEAKTHDGNAETIHRQQY